MDIELNKMLLVYINGNLIENIIIQDNKLLFSDVDSKYYTVPVNEYEEGTDKYLAVESVFNFMELYSEEGRESFKNCCLLMYTEGNTSFNYEDYSIYLEAIERNEEIIIV